VYLGFRKGLGRLLVALTQTASAFPYSETWGLGSISSICRAMPAHDLIDQFLAETSGQLA
jgi:hypothetical protein